MYKSVCVRIDLDGSFDIGIPDEAAAMEWPSKKLKVTILQEFLNLDNQYKEGLNRLKEQHQHILKFVYLIHVF